MATLRYPKGDPATVEAHPDQARLVRYALELDAPEEDGQQRLSGTLQVLAPARGAAAVWVQLAFRGSDGGLVGAATVSAPASAGATVDIDVEETVTLAGSVERISLHTAAEQRLQVPLPGGNATTSVLAARAWVTEPDEVDGAQQVRALVEVDHTGLPVEQLRLTAVLALEGGSTDTLDLPLERGLCRGHQLVASSDWYLPIERPAAGASLRLEICERTWVGGPTLDVSGVITGPPRARALPALPTPSRVTPPADAGPWELVDGGFFDAAIAAFAGTELDKDGRDRVRTMLRSPDPLEVSQATLIAGATGHKSSVSGLRRLLRHDSPLVRAAAARAIGTLGGPSMLVPVRALLDDPDPQVQEAAKAAVAALDR